MMSKKKTNPVFPPPKDGKIYRVLLAGGQRYHSSNIVDSYQGKLQEYGAQILLHRATDSNQWASPIPPTIDFIIVLSDMLGTMERKLIQATAEKTSVPVIIALRKWSVIQPELEARGLRRISTRGETSSPAAPAANPLAEPAKLNVHELVSTPPDAPPTPTTASPASPLTPNDDEVVFDLIIEGVNDLLTFVQHFRARARRPSASAYDLYLVVQKLLQQKLIRHADLPEGIFDRAPWDPSYAQHLRTLVEERVQDPQEFRDTFRERAGTTHSYGAIKLRLQQACDLGVVAKDEDTETLIRQLDLRQREEGKLMSEIRQEELRQQQTDRQAAKKRAAAIAPVPFSRPIPPPTAGAVVATPPVPVSVPRKSRTPGTVVWRAEFAPVLIGMLKALPEPVDVEVFVRGFFQKIGAQVSFGTLRMQIAFMRQNGFIAATPAVTKLLSLIEQKYEKAAVVASAPSAPPAAVALPPKPPKVDTRKEAKIERGRVYEYDGVRWASAGAIAQLAACSRGWVENLYGRKLYQRREQTPPYGAVFWVYPVDDVLRVVEQFRARTIPEAKDHARGLKPKPQENTCFACLAPVTPAAKYCAECGTPQVKRCGGCATTLTPSAKFCPECGKKA